MHIWDAPKNDLIAKEIKKAKDKGVVVIAAAGNDGKQEVLYPASDQNAIAVGAYTPNLSRASYSNYGKKVTIFAPGGQIVLSSTKDAQSTSNSAQAFCEPIERLTPADPRLDQGIVRAWTKMTKRGSGSEFPLKGEVCAGTSQATGAVSGTVALMKAAGVKTTDTIARILTTSARRDCREPSVTGNSGGQTPVETSTNLDSPFEPGSVGRLDAGTAVLIAKQHSDSRMSDNIALARYLTEIKAKVYGGFTCSPNSIYNTIFGKAAFSELDYLEVPKHNREQGNRGWEIKGKQYGFVESLEKLADLSGYTGGRNFVFSEKYKLAEEYYREEKRFEAEQRQSQPSRSQP